MTAALWVLAALVVAAGIVGTVLPALPGVPLVFAGLLLAAWLDGFAKVGAVTIAVLAILTLGAVVVDYASSALGAARMGASRTALWGAAIGTLVGAFFALPGLLVGPFLGAAAGELLVRRELRQAGKVGLGAWIGFVFGTLAKLALAFAMVAIFALAYLL